MKLEGMAEAFGKAVSERFKPKSVITEVAQPTISDPDFVAAANAWLGTHSFQEGFAAWMTRLPAMEGLQWSPAHIGAVATAIFRSYGISRRLDVANLTCSDWGDVFKHIEPNLQVEDTSFKRFQTQETNQLHPAKYKGIQ